MSTDDVPPTRKFGPIEAAHVVAQYLPADTAFWIERCEATGTKAYVFEFDDGRPRELRVSDAEGRINDDVTFLTTWLDLTPGAREMVIAYLVNRGQRRRG